MNVSEAPRLLLGARKEMVLDYSLLDTIPGWAAIGGHPHLETGWHGSLALGKTPAVQWEPRDAPALAFEVDAGDVCDLFDPWLDRLAGNDWRAWKQSATLVQQLARLFLAAPETTLQVRFRALKLEENWTQFSRSFRDLANAYSRSCGGYSRSNLDLSRVECFCLRFAPPAHDEPVYWIGHVADLLEHIWASPDLCAAFAREDG